jgi:hypothetical protein
VCKLCTLLLQRKMLRFLHELAKKLKGKTKKKKSLRGFVKAVANANTFNRMASRASSSVSEHADEDEDEWAAFNNINSMSDAGFSSVANGINEIMGSHAMFFVAVSPAAARETNNNNLTSSLPFAVGRVRAHQLPGRPACARVRMLIIGTRS